MQAPHPLTYRLPPLPAATTEKPAADDEQPSNQEWAKPWMGPFLRAMSEVPAVGRAAERVGVHRTTVWRTMEAYADFAAAVGDAREIALDRLEHTMYLRTTVGTPVRKTVTKTQADGTVEITVTEESHISDTLGMFLLKRWRPEYRESFRVEQSGPGGGPIVIQHRAEEMAERFDAKLIDLDEKRAERNTEIAEG